MHRLRGFVSSFFVPLLRSWPGSAWRTHRGRRKASLLPEASHLGWHDQPGGAASCASRARRGWHGCGPRFVECRQPSMESVHSTRAQRCSRLRTHAGCCGPRPHPVIKEGAGVAKSSLPVVSVW